MDHERGETHEAPGGCSLSGSGGFPSTEDVASSLRSRLAISAGELLGLFPLEDIIRSLDSQEHLGDYGRVPHDVQVSWRRIEERWGGVVLEDCRKLLLVELIRRYRERGKARSYPDSIHALFVRCFRRILAHLDRQPAGFYRHGNDLFDKDLAVCREKLVPTGPQLLDVKAGIARSALLRAGVRGGASLLGFTTRRLGGFQPLYEMHMENRMLREFTQGGWERSYRRMAELLERNPEVRGVYGTSWWYAPEIGTISPQLAYLRALPMDNGARIFPLGESEAAVRDATTNSKRRRELWERGEFQPGEYLMIWPRKKLLQWAAETPRGEGG